MHPVRETARINRLDCRREPVVVPDNLPVGAGHPAGARARPPPAQPDLSGEIGPARLAD